jgi:glutamate/tyrosine decarboxylase-like PLP-dependent enzyme
MDLGQLEQALKTLAAAGRRATIVATMGTTGMGAVDPLHDILELARVYGARVHADAAYGGYFKLCALNEASDMAAFEALGRADSVVIDPHKHGLQPFGCGAVLFKNPKEGKFYKHDSPYTYFTSDQLHLGEITLECSRPGAAAAALWATLQKFPLEKGGEFAQRLEFSLAAARGLTQLLEDEGYWVIDPALDICVFSKKGLKASQVSAENREFFEKQARAGVHLALFKLAPAQCPWPIELDQDELVVVRSVLMKPEHNDPILWGKIAGLA